MDKAYFLDKLHRTLQMEEEMVAVLMDLLDKQGLPKGLPASEEKRATAILQGIRSDSLRHRQANLDMITAIEKGA